MGALVSVVVFFFFLFTVRAADERQPTVRLNHMSRSDRTSCYGSRPDEIMYDVVTPIY